MNTEIAKALFSSHTYSEYRKLMVDLLTKGKSTAVVQTEEMTYYSKLNAARMQRLDKTMKISEANALQLKNVSQSYIWLVLTEGWCGDAAQILPILHKMAEASDGKIEMKLVLRDQNVALMHLFLTNKAKAIPKLIIVDKATGEVVANWGPRPQGAIDLIENYKEKRGAIDDTVKAQLQLWYLHDKGVSTQIEILQLMK